MSIFQFSPKQLKVNYTIEEVYQIFGIIHLNIHSNFILQGIDRETKGCRIFGEIPLPFKGKLISDVEIALYNPYYFGNATATCLTIPGVIARQK